MTQYSLDEKYRLICEAVMETEGNDPMRIVKSVMHRDFVNIHGPEHHFLDGAALMVALRRSGMDFDLKQSLGQLAERTIKMPGAMCGYWGVCGSVASVGAVFSILDGTGPLSSDAPYSDHMAFTARVINKMGEIGGPRCCKRNAFLSLSEGIASARAHYGVDLKTPEIVCEFTSFNPQCIATRCPFYRGTK